MSAYGGLSASSGAVGEAFVLRGILGQVTLGRFALGRNQLSKRDPAKGGWRWTKTG